MFKSFYCRISVCLLIFGMGFLPVLFNANATTLAQAVPVNVTTHHNDNNRTGQNLSETKLNTFNVSAGTFGKLFSRDVDGDIYAQPLYVSNLSIQGGQHNVVFVATMHNSVYAFDADDPNQAAPLWSVNLGPSAPSSDFDFGGTYTNINPEVGITSTPVIDLDTNTIYVVALIRTSSASDGHSHQLFALDILTGQNKTGSPVTIAGSVPGTGDTSSNGTLTFNSRTQLQRPALLLVKGATNNAANNLIYVAFGSYADNYPYWGWVMAYDATSLQQVGIFNDAPDTWSAGIWMSGEGPSADQAGNVYLSAGNGPFNTSVPDLRDSIMKLRVNNTNPPIPPFPANWLELADWFRPYNYDYLNSTDNDLGSTGVLLIPGTNLAVTGSKEGKLYVLDQTNLGHFQANSDSQIVQSFFAVTPGSLHNIHGAPVYWNSPTKGPMIYIWPEQEKLEQFKLVNGLFETTPSTESLENAPPGMPGGFLSISANGNIPGTGIVWATHPYSQDANNAVVEGVLEAYDADDLSRQLWSSKLNPTRDDVGNFAKFNPPTIANGKVYLGTFSKKLLVYGLLSAADCASLAVTSNTDTGDSEACGTLSSAISLANYNYTQTGTAQHITFGPGVTGINFTGSGYSLPKIGPGVLIDGGSCAVDGTPGVTISGNGWSSGSAGVWLEGDKDAGLKNLWIKGFNELQLKVLPGGNNNGAAQLHCVRAGGS